MSLIVNDDIEPQNKENLNAILEAYKQYPYGLLPRARVIPTRPGYRSNVDHEQVARHEEMLVARQAKIGYLGIDRATYTTVIVPLYHISDLPWPLRLLRLLRGGRWPWARRRG